MTAIAPDTLVLNWLLTLPFFAAICVELFPRLAIRPHSEWEADAMKRGPFYLGALVCLMGIGLTICLFPLTLAGRPVGADYWWTRDLYHLRFQADALSTLVVLALYWLVLLIQLHLGGQPSSEGANHRAALLLVAMGCGAVAALSADLILLIFSLEAALLALWLLVSLEAPRPADHLLVTAHAGGLLTLAGALMMWHEAGDSSLAALPLLLMSSPSGSLGLMGGLVVLGLAPRLACVPGHGWLPRVTGSGVPAALAPAVLLPVIAGAAVLRLVPGSLLLATIPALGKLGLVLGLGALWWGAVRAWLSHELRQLACWLTVAGSGYLLVALGAAASPSAPPQVLQAAALHVLVAPLALLAVWCSAGTVSACVGTDSLAGLSGLIRKMPLAAAALLIGGLSLVGSPPLPGFQPQRLLLSGLVQSGSSWLAAAVVFADLLIAGAVLDAFRKAFMRREPPPALRWTSSWFSVNLAAAVLGMLVIGLWSAPLIRWSEMVFRGVLSISP